MLMAFLTAPSHCSTEADRPQDAAFERRLPASPSIADELGYSPADAHGGDLLYNTISRRQQQRPTVIEIDLPPED
jgi:hypothetical protein